MDSNQIYVHLLFEYKKNKLDLDTMPSLLFIQYKYKTINSTNKNHTYINYLWNKHIENIHIKIFDNHNILIDFDVIKRNQWITTVSQWKKKFPFIIPSHQ